MPKILFTDQHDLDLVTLLAEGKTIKEACWILKMNFRTIEGRIRNLKKRENALSIPHLVAKLMARGLISPEV